MPRGCAPTAAYQPRQPTDTLLYRTVEAHLETFLAHIAGGAERSGLPVFVKREFEAYLRCGILAHEFARVRCEGCAFEHLVPFSGGARGLTCLGFAGGRAWQSLIAATPDADRSCPHPASEDRKDPAAQVFDPKFGIRVVRPPE